MTSPRVKGKATREMIKVYVHVLALVSVLAFSAIGASAAFAESEFLIGGVAPVVGQEVHAEGELELTDLKGLGGLTVVAILCSALVTGTYDAANDALLTKVFNLSNAELTTLPTASNAGCTNVQNCPSPEVYLDNLPWLKEVVLVGNEPLLRITSSVAGEPAGTFPGGELVCHNLGGTQEALCEGLVTGKVTNNPAEEDFDVTVSLAEQEAAKELGTCFENGSTFTEAGHVDGTLLVLKVGELAVAVS